MTKTYGKLIRIGIQSTLVIFGLYVISACKKAEVQDNGPRSVTISVSLQDKWGGVEKTSVHKEDDKFVSIWSAGDCVSVNGKVSEPLEEKDLTNPRLANFTINDLILEPGDICNMLYPGTSSENTFTIPAEQVYSGALYPGAAAPMWGTVRYEEGNLTLSQISSILAFKLKGSVSLGRFILTAKGGEKIAGEYSIGTTTDGMLDGTITGGSSSSIEAELQGGVELDPSAATMICVPVIAGEVSNGFSLALYDVEGRYMTLKFFGSGKTLKSTKAYTFPEVEFVPGATVVIAPVGTMSDGEDIVIEDQLVVGTYNILYSGGRADNCPNNTWDKCKSTTAQILQSMGCDVMTVNEVEDEELNYLKETLNGYSWVAKKNNIDYWLGSVVKNSEYKVAPTIIYKNTRLEKLDDGIFWLNTPNPSSLVNVCDSYSYTDNNVTYTAAKHRCCVWAKFRDVQTGEMFYWFAAHPHIRSTDSGSSKANTNECLNAVNCRSLVAQIPMVNTEELPVLVGGDMNSPSTHPGYQTIIGLGLTNAREAAVAAGCVAGDVSTCPGYSPENYDNNLKNEASRIDHVFYTGSAFDVRGYTTIATKYDCPVDGMRFPSDHIPVRVVLAIK